MNTRRTIRALPTLALVLGSGFWAPPAQAYNWGTHKKMVEVAVSAMKYIEGLQPWQSRPSPPADVSQQDWDAYLDAVQQAPAKLSTLRVGTFHRGETDFIDPSMDNTCTCGYDFRHNMAVVEANRIMDLAYVPNRPGGSCGLSSSPSAKVLGGVLGWHAAMIDDHLDDTVLWVRPFNTANASELKDAADHFWHSTMSSLMVPLACILKWLTFRSCHYRDGEDLANLTNPTNQVDSWVPGFGESKSSDYTGLWHFMQFDGPAGVYNPVHGMDYDHAGPHGIPGCVDVVLQAAGDVTGLSLNAAKSDGVKHYGSFDQSSRTEGMWQGLNYGHLEFSPLTNLAEYGAARYAGQGWSADNLGWPLHGIDDATVPQHLVGTSSWGHRPYEDWVELHWDTLFPSSLGGVGPDKLDQTQAIRILGEGARSWRLLQGTHSAGAFVYALGSWTRADLEAHGDWPFKDSASYDYHRGLRGQAIGQYDVEQDRIRGLVERGAGAVSAYLAWSARHAVDPGYVTSVKCAAGSYYSFTLKACVAGMAECPEPNPMPPPCPIGMSAEACAANCTPVQGHCGAFGEKACCYPLVCNDTHICAEASGTCAGLNQSCMYGPCCLSQNLYCTGAYICRPMLTHDSGPPPPP
jgi:hypothetical protein